VVTFAVTVCEADPFSVIEDGDSEQVDWAGAPLQVNCTVCSNPPSGAKVKRVRGGLPR
jgi:hypothetical protein